MVILLQSAAEFNRINMVIDTIIRTKKIYELPLLYHSLTSLRTDCHVQTPKGQSQLFAQCTISKIKQSNFLS